MAKNDKELDKVLDENAKAVILAEETDKVDTKDSDDKAEDETPEVKAEEKRVRLLQQSYRPEDQPPVEDKADAVTVVPAGAVAKDTAKPTDGTIDVPGAVLPKDTSDPTKGDKPVPGQGAVPTTPAKSTTRESVEAIFHGAELSEDFKERAETIFNAALNLRLDEEVERIEEAAQVALAERVLQIEKELSDKVDTYVEYAVTGFMEENKVAIESGIRQEIAEDFITDLKDLFESHNITVPAEKVDLLDAAQKQVAELAEQVNTLTETLLESNKEIFAFQKSEVVATLAEGLALTQVEKLNKLVKDIDAKDLESFKEKATLVKESFFKESKPAITETESGAVISETTTKTVDAGVAKYMQAAKRLNSND